MTDDRPVRIAAVNFWPGFVLTSGFIGHLLRRAYGAFVATADESAADLVLTSVFLGNRPRHPERTISIVWENLRPNFDIAHYAISSDFDSYGGRNCRCPYWYSQVAWDGYALPPEPPGASNHGFEAPIGIDTLMAAREPRLAGGREKFCCLVAGNPEGHRVLAAEELGRIGTVDRFGGAFGKPLRRSKLEVLPEYRFNLCFENSIFPGYYTEKPVHAWAAGCVPLYFADPHIGRDLNPRALVNRLDFATLADFAQYVCRLEASPDMRAEIVAQPLVIEPPSIEPVVAFLRETLAKVRKISRPPVGMAAAQPRGTSTAAPAIAKVSRNAPCPCGSGLKYKRCHGQTA